MAATGSFTVGTAGILGVISIIPAKSSGSYTITPPPLEGVCTIERAVSSGSFTISPADMVGMVSRAIPRSSGVFQLEAGPIEGVFTITSRTAAGTIDIKVEVDCDKNYFKITDVTDYAEKELNRSTFELSVSIQSVSGNGSITPTPNNTNETLVQYWEGEIPTEISGDPIDDFYKVVVTDNASSDVVNTYYMALTCKSKEKLDEIEQYITDNCICENCNDVYNHYLAISGFYISALAANRLVAHDDAFKFLDELDNSYQLCIVLFRLISPCFYK
jgi:hypothetical protein